MSHHVAWHCYSNFSTALPCCSSSSRNRTPYITISRLRRAALPPTRSGRLRGLTSFRDGLCDISLSAISAGSYRYLICSYPCLAYVATDPGRRGGIQPSHRARFIVGLNKGGAWPNISPALNNRGTATPATTDMAHTQITYTRSKRYFHRVRLFPGRHRSAPARSRFDRAC
ncbi:hypothetical protein GY45DRAFT_1325084 [Cubamyces sp. BRFM 1775]|nr:hypothetical protein GY45DRAFT_1325084 [Cubamyces sp. BRFM 1775]